MSDDPPKIASGADDDRTPSWDDDVTAREMMLRDRDLKIVDAHVAQLMEHFESVQILVTRIAVPANGERGGTIHCERGDGNWYARLQQARSWYRENEK